MKSSYEVRTSDEERGEAPSDDNGDSKSDSSSDSNNSDSGHGDDDNNSDSESNNSEDYDSQYSGNDWGEPLCDREYEDEGLYYEDYDDNVDYYDEDIEDDAEAEPIDMGRDAESDQYRLLNLLEDAGEEIEQANDVDYDDYPMGASQIRAISLMLVQGPILDMTSMVERFLSWGHSIIQSLAH